jgi:putative membrane protein
MKVAKPRRTDMSKPATIGPFPAWLLLTSGGVAALASSPAIFSLIGWSDGSYLARFDPILSLCLASRPSVQPEQFWASWSLAPQIVLPLILLAALYGRGLLAQWSLHRGHLKPARISMFAGGMLLLAVALLSPLCRLAATLAWAHMIQHILIVAIIPPMLIMGQPLMTVQEGLQAWWCATPHPKATLTRSWLDRPALASVLYAAAIWLSHAPTIYEAALIDPTVHLLLLGFQLSAGLLFWRIMIRCVTSPAPGRDGRAGPALLMAFSTFMPTNLLGALLTFASVPWFSIYGLRPQIWGISALEDQQLAGVIMWVPMSAIFLAAGLTVMAQLLKEHEPRSG